LIGSHVKASTGNKSDNHLTHQITSLNIARSTKDKRNKHRQLFNPLDYLSINPAVLDVFTYLVKQRTNNTTKAAYNLLAYKKTCHTFTNKLAKRQNKPSAATSFLRW
jgi:hypothetical protein